MLKKRVKIIRASSSEATALRTGENRNENATENESENRIRVRLRIRMTSHFCIEPRTNSKHSFLYSDSDKNEWLIIHPCIQPFILLLDDFNFGNTLRESVLKVTQRLTISYDVTSCDTMVNHVKCKHLVENFSC